LPSAAATPPASARIPSRERAQRALAWCVHLLTASGGVLGTLALVALFQHKPERTGILMLCALAIDSVDGSLARRARVAEVVPSLDGRRLDDIVDFLNYAVVPVVFMVWLGALHPLLAVAPVVASAYGFSQHDAKTEDDFFLGWPSYWNVVALYVWRLEISPATTGALVLLFSAAVFVPLKYAYPSKLRRLRGATVAGATAWILAMAYAVAWPERARAVRLTEITLLFPAWYVGLSAWLGGWWRRRS
jgi:phosphatidylcholine synthase